MRCIAVVLLILALLTPRAMAQGVHIGGTLGLNRTWYSGDFGGERLTPTFGVTLTKDIWPPVALHAEVLYTQKGTKEHEQYRMSIAYLELPLLVQLALGSGDVQPIGVVGIAPAVELSCGGVTPDVQRFVFLGPRPQPLDCDGERSDKTDVGVILGLRLNVTIGLIRWSAALRYTHGLNDLDDGSPYLTRANRAVSVLIGVAR